ncbi:MAG: chemotaxis protein CheW [Candidatus Riflebacteria bacterium HGW-Riflebacteria-2]|jgi:purine-binding chemotaxis protein CheW|nr:MAG: chemotaxis protein CheW [Candidatus Riflebacteria bacterium HGW-Riflebacteria-2]
MTEKKKPQIIIRNESEQEILHTRAQALAQAPEKVVPASELLDIIVFSLGGEAYGIESVFVREVYPLKDFTPLPGVPAFVLGIINVRGQILSVIDLKKFFGLPEKGLGQLNKVIILHNNLMEFGLLADDIVGTTSVLLSGMQASLPTITGIGREFLKGITSERLIILDGEKILNDKEMIVHEEIAFMASK